MRLWHYELLDVLPQQQLVSQWRECIAIKRQWGKGTLKHRLVSYVLNHGKAYFYQYTILLVNEMIKRKIKFNIKYVDEISDFCHINTAELKWRYNNELYYPEHDKRYLKQCLFNLQEKYDRGIVSEEEWQKIYNKFQNILDIH